MTPKRWPILDLDKDASEGDIKRAYAQRLRERRPDDDADGFGALRAEYEAALSMRRRPAVTIPRLPARVVRQLRVAAETAAPAGDATGFSDPGTIVQAEIRALIDAGDLLGACARYDRARAASAIGIAEEPGIEWQLAQCFLADTKLSGSELAAVARRYRWDDAIVVFPLGARIIEKYRWRRRGEDLEAQLLNAHTFNVLFATNEQYRETLFLQRLLRSDPRPWERLPLRRIKPNPQRLRMLAEIRDHYAYLSGRFDEGLGLRRLAFEERRAAGLSRRALVLRLLIPIAWLIFFAVVSDYMISQHISFGAAPPNAPLTAYADNPPAGWRKLEDSYLNEKWTSPSGATILTLQQTNQFPPDPTFPGVRVRITRPSCSVFMPKQTILKYRYVTATVVRSGQTTRHETAVIPWNYGTTIWLQSDMEARDVADPVRSQVPAAFAHAICLRSAAQGP
jgi:hypothetical protein